MNVVSSDDPRPPYIQVADHLRAVVGDEYRPGQRLPAGRVLARELGIAPNTMQRAVDLLKAEGLLVSYPTRGIFVRSPEDDETTPSTEPSAEYAEIMRHLDDVQKDVRSLAERLAQIEKLVKTETSRPSKRSRRPSS